MFSAFDKELPTVHFEMHVKKKALACLYNTDEIRQGGNLLDIIVADFL